MTQTHKAIKLARQKMDVSRMLRDEKAYYQQWLDELEQAIQEEETQVSVEIGKGAVRCFWNLSGYLGKNPKNLKNVSRAFPAVALLI